ncbi:sporulation protein YabP [Desulfolucanica intricata]|uniref:sporulation protein YabP n=1 Tax=Desulfolucanica intricata TaxID=1285191 RepID=UPI000835B166|nr:sporulation protein YabP [Desulfolucanica intricata]
MESHVQNRILLTDRKHLALEGVQHVGSFDEREICLDTNMGFLLLKGEDLHITQLNLDSGRLVVEGYISSMEFQDGRSAKGMKAKGKGVLSRILK